MARYRYRILSALPPSIHGGCSPTGASHRLAADKAFPTTTTPGVRDLSHPRVSHDADTVQLYFQESLTFLVYTAEASVALTAGGAA